MSCSYVFVKRNIYLQVSDSLSILVVDEEILLQRCVRCLFSEVLNTGTGWLKPMQAYLFIMFRMRNNVDIYQGLTNIRILRVSHMFGLRNTFRLD